MQLEVAADQPGVVGGQDRADLLMRHPEVVQNACGRSRRWVHLHPFEAERRRASLWKTLRRARTHRCSVLPNIGAPVSSSDLRSLMTMAQPPPPWKMWARLATCAAVFGALSSS